MPDERQQDVPGGSWILDSGPGQFKAICAYVPAGVGKFVAIEYAGIDFDWSLGGLKPTVIRATTLCGILELAEDGAKFALVGFALDDRQRAVYAIKVVGTKTVVDQDTLNVENMVFHFYENPESANLNADQADFCIPASGTFPPIREYRIKI